MSLNCAEQMDFVHVENQQGSAHNKAKMKAETFRFNLTISTDSNTNSDDTYVHRKELGDESLQICENKDVCPKTTDAFLEDDKKNEENKIKVITQAVAAGKTKKKIFGKKEKKNNLLLIDKKENLKKISNSNKTVKQKAPTKRTNKTSSGTSSLNKYYKHTDKELKQNYKKLELLKIDEKYFDKYPLPPFACIKANASNKLDTNICYGISKQQQELNQYSLESNRNALQYLDYNNLRQVHQQTMSGNSNPWLMGSRGGQNFQLNNSVTNIQNEGGQDAFINDRQHHIYSTAADYSWKQNENLYTNCSIDSTNPYKMVSSEYKAYCLCNLVHSPNCMWNNTCFIEDFPRTNAPFQQTPSIGSNYVTSTTVSNSFLNPMAAPFNPYHYYQSSPTDFRKLYYTSLNTVNYANNSGCEVTVKENMMSLCDIWHPANSITTTNNNNLNISRNISMAPWSDISYPFYTERANVYQNQHKERNNVAQYTGYALEGTLLEMHELEPPKTDNKSDNETATLCYEDNMATSTNYIMSDIAELLSGTEIATCATSEVLTPCIYDKKK